MHPWSSNLPPLIYFVLSLLIFLLTLERNESSLFFYRVCRQSQNVVVAVVFVTVVVVYVAVVIVVVSVVVVVNVVVAVDIMRRRYFKASFSNDLL